MAQTPSIVKGREAFARRKWSEAYRHLSAADTETPLEPADLERVAAAAYLLGKDAQATAVWTRAHHGFIDRGQVERAARWGFWLSLHMLLAGETAQATGWLARSQRLLRDREETCVDKGYGLIGEFEQGTGGSRRRGDASRAGAR